MFGNNKGNNCVRRISELFDYYESIRILNFESAKKTDHAYFNFYYIFILKR